MTRTRLSSIIFATLIFSITAAIAAQIAGPPEYDLSWHTIDGGGGASTGGGFELSGTIGQPDASSVAMSGGDFTLVGGFWAGAGGPAPSTCPADLAPAQAGDGLVNVDDLLVLLQSWGACANPNDCPADLAPPQGDDNVNVDDLLVLLQAWGMCP